MRPRFAEEDEEMTPYHLRGGGMKRSSSSQKAQDEASLLEMFGAASSSGTAGDGGFGFVSGGGLQDQRSAEPSAPAVKPAKKKKKKKKSSAPVIEERASWEHGLGRKLLKGMGWKGHGGLGADGKGITQAIDVVVRPAFAGLRERDEKSDTMVQLERQRFGLDEEEEEEEDEAEQELQRANKWRRIKMPQHQGSNVVYKTAQQVLEEKDLAAVKVIDLTGAPVSNFRPTTHDQGPLRELRYNVSRLLDNAELELRATNQKLKGAERRYETFSVQLTSLESSLAEDERMAEQLEQLSALLGRLESQSAAMAQVGSPEELTPRLTGIFQSIAAKYPELYAAHDVRGSLLSLLIPTLKPYFEQWDFVEAPGRGTAMMPALLDALGVRWYSQLVWQLVLPPIRSYVFANWPAKRQPYTLLSVLHAWQAHFPPRTMQHVLHQLVVPRLRREAQNWRPDEDLVAPQTWIQPWMNMLGDSLEREVFPSLVATLGTALRDGWDVEDMTLFALVQSWPDFIPGHLLQPVTSMHIMPVLTSYAAKWDPAKPEFLNCLLAWNRWIKFEHFVSRRVFPQMARHLYAWVTSANPPGVDELRSWYENLKGAFPEDALTSPIRTMLAHTLDIIKNVLIEDQRHFQPDLVPATVVLDRKKKSQKRKVTTPQDAVSFKDMVQAFAAQHNVVFLPSSRVNAQGHKLYSFGGKLVRLHDNVVYTEDGTPTTLEALVQN